MFLHKDLLDDDSQVGLVRANAPNGRPCTPGGLSTSAGNEDAAEEVTTPGSVVNMRAKMMQQREKLLAKQRAAVTGSASMVMANQGLPPADASTTAATGQRKSPKSPTVPSFYAPGSVGRTGMNAFGEPSPGSSFSSRLFASSASREEALDDEEREGGERVAAAPPATKEEEEARRKALARELSERGIQSEFDPAGSGDAYLPAFDLTSVAHGDMRAFLHAPVPRTAGTFQCRIVRDRSGISTKLHPKYMMESDSGVFLMSAQKQVKNKTSNYAISMTKSASSKDAESFLGKLRSDFLGIEWNAYGPGLNPAKADLRMPTSHAARTIREELCAVQYTASKWGASAKGPRKMAVAIPRVQPSGERIVCRTMNPQLDGLAVSLKNAGQGATGGQQHVEIYSNKPPKWNDAIGAYVLNFNKRVTEASVKNFQLISSTDPETVFLQFGRVGKEVFNLDFRWPMSPFQAFAMCLSSFDYKLGCE